MIPQGGYIASMAKVKVKKIVKKATDCGKCSEVDLELMQHPNHSEVLSRLSRVQGQVNGIEKMIHDQRYCVDILVQLRAAMAALRAIEAEVFQSHLKHCVQSAVLSRDPKRAQEKIDELTELLNRRTQL